MRHVLAALALVALAAPAFACLNDKELPRHEREFRSQYQGSDAPTESTSTPTGQYLLYGAGGTLLGGAAIVALNVRRRKS